MSAKRNLSTFVLTGFFALPAYSLDLVCQSKYFNGTPASMHLTASSRSENELTNVSLKIGGEEIRNVSLSQGQAYNGRTYKNMQLYVLPQNGSSKPGWESTSLSLLLPQGWGEQGHFVGYVVEKSSDGGSYNKVFCGTID